MSALGGRAVVPATWPEPPLIAETVEKVRTIKFCATIVRVSRSCSNIDSTKSRILHHCFKYFEIRDFFNSLSREPTLGARQTTSQFGTHVTSVDVVERINACCTSLATIWALSVPTAGVILLVSLMQLR